MGVTIYPAPSAGVGAKVDKSAAVPFNVVNNTSFALTATYQIVRSESGKKGFLNDFTFALPASGSFRITVDGSVKYDVTQTVGGGYFVIGTRDIFVSAGTTTFLAFATSDTAGHTLSALNTTVGYLEVPLGYSGSVSNAIVVSMLADSLYFNTSLLIEAKVTTGTGTGKYRLAGGSY